MVNEAFKKSVLWANAVLGPLAALAAWRLGGIPALTAAVAGNAIGLANLVAMAWLMGRLLAAERGRALYGGVIALKLGAVLAIIALLLWALKLHIVGFLLGFSGLVAALVIGSLMASLAPARDTAPPASDRPDGAWNASTTSKNQEIG